mmetsp:Transcript_128550/g.181342  ORF Transcript_128550/g.181342 Transcript_128550/m.181342 type:complete len:231 (-) Transcript_128550:830-1522(-)
MSKNRTNGVAPSCSGVFLLLARDRVPKHLLGVLLLRRHLDFDGVACAEEPVLKALVHRHFSNGRALQVLALHHIFLALIGHLYLVVLHVRGKGAEEVSNPAQRRRCRQACHLHHAPFRDFLVVALEQHSALELTLECFGGAAFAMVSNRARLHGTQGCGTCRLRQLQWLVTQCLMEAELELVDLGERLRLLKFLWGGGHAFHLLGGFLDFLLLFFQRRDLFQFFHHLRTN